jgi:large subunit ribosomal protein L10
MKRKQEKRQDAQKLHGELATVSSVILSTFSGLTVEQETKLRRAVEAAGGRYRVVKNAVAEQAGAGTPAEALLKGLAGVNSIAYTTTDPAALAKALTRAVKDVPAFQFKAGLVEGRVLSVEEIQQLAQLPPRQELLTKVAFLLGAPARRLAVSLAALERNLAVVLDQAVQANKFAQSAGGNESNAE